MQKLVDEKNGNQEQIGLPTVYSRTQTMNRSHTARTTNFKAFFVLLLMGAFLHPTALATPDAGDAVAAWYAARNWVDETARDVAENDPGVPLVQGATACCVILRFDGRLVGLGTAEEDPADMVRLATMRALEDALDDQTISALPEDLRGDAGKRLGPKVTRASLLALWGWFPLACSGPGFFEVDRRHF